MSVIKVCLWSQCDYVQLAAKTGIAVAIPEKWYQHLCWALSSEHWRGFVVGRIIGMIVWSMLTPVAISGPQV